MRLEILDTSGNPVETEPRLVSHTHVCQFMMTFIRTGDQVLHAESDRVDIAYPDLLEISEKGLMRGSQTGVPHIYRFTPADDPGKFEGISTYAEHSARVLPHSDTQ